MSSDVSTSAGSDRSALRVAYIAALFGVVGTLCGGVVAYLGNRALQDQQTQQQNALEAKATRTAARLAVFRYQTYENLVTEMLLQREYYKQPLPQPLSPADEALVVASLSTGGLDALALADLGTTFVRTVLKGERDEAPLKVGDMITLDEARSDITKGLVVLKRIATQPLS